MVRKPGESGMCPRLEGDGFCFVKLDMELSSLASRFLFQLILQRQTQTSQIRAPPCDS